MKNYQIIKAKELSQYKGFKRVDFRDSGFHLISDLPVGAGDCHDMAIANNEKRQYMTYCSKSPFGKAVVNLMNAQKML